jgi:transcription elongation factor GreA
MQTPIRKAGKYTSLKPDPNITQKKYIELQKKLENLKFKRPHLIKEVKTLALDGDFSENHAYSLAKGRLRGMNQRILNITDHLKRAQIIKENKNRNKVELGCTVTIKISNKEKTYQILGSSETDPNKNIISHNSPLGQILMGHTVGDKIKAQIAQKEIKYEIIKIK